MIYDDMAAGTTSRRIRKQKQMRQKLTAAAMELFSTHGYNSVTMEQIANRADVAKGTLYNHFPIKEALIAAWVHEEMEHSREKLLAEVRTHQDFRSRMLMFLEASREWCEANKAYLPAYLRYRLLDLGDTAPGGGMHTLDGVGWSFAELIGEAQKNGELRDDLPAEQLAEFLAHIYLGALMRWLAGKTPDLNAGFESMLNLFLDGVIVTDLSP
ncbi:MAG: TetR/AcrR family transcriptional regulator [Nitratireductor sp.]